jgi:hypothetical protein
LEEVAFREIVLAFLQLAIHKVVFIGVSGSAGAYELSKRGKKVLLIEQYEDGTCGRLDRLRLTQI